MTGITEARAAATEALSGKPANARLLAWRVIEQARILAYQPPTVAQPPLGFRGGLVLGDSEEDRRLRHTRWGEPVDSFDPSAVVERRLAGHYAYGGMTDHHFGHFMAEMVHRILPSRLHDPGHKFLFVGALRHRRDNFALLPRYVQDIYTFLGLGPDSVNIVTENTDVESLYVCEAGSEIGGPKPAYLDILDDYTGPKLESIFGSVPRHGRVYVSRSKLGVRGGLCGERYLESALQAEGYEIFHPQDHSVTEQMDRYRKAEVVIFVQGSACHGTELLGRRAMKNCIMLNRRGEAGWFDRVLAPRAEQYSKFRSCTNLGTIYTNAAGSGVRGRSVSVLDWDALVDFLRNAGAARLSSSSSAGYMAAAADDVRRYTEATEFSRRYSKDPDRVAELVGKFEAVKRSV